MSRFIKLTTTDGGDCFVDPYYVTHVIAQGSGGTQVSGKHSLWVLVRESATEVTQMLDEREVVGWIP